MYSYVYLVAPLDALCHDGVYKLFHHFTFG